MTADEIQARVGELVRADDPRALDLLYETYADPLMGFLVSRLRHRGDAEDALQQLFLDLARNPRQLLRARRLTPWIFTKARNLSTDVFRARERAARRDEALFADCLEPAPEVTPEPAAADLVRLAGAVARLPEAQREVLVMKSFQQRTFAEIGAALGLSINTAASRYRYALEKLREWLAGDPDDEHGQA